MSSKLIGILFCRLAKIRGLRGPTWLITWLSHLTFGAGRAGTHGTQMLLTSWCRLLVSTTAPSAVTLNLESEDTRTSSSSSSSSSGSSAAAVGSAYQRYAATNSVFSRVFFVKKYWLGWRANQWPLIEEDILHSLSPRLDLWPFKGLLRWPQGPSTSPRTLLPELERYKDTVRCLYR